MISSIDEMMSEGEELEESVHPSPKDSHYLKNYVYSAFLAVFTVILVIWLKLKGASLFEPLYLLLLLVIPLWLASSTELKRRFRFYHFTDRKMLEESGILNKNYSNVNYSNITDVHMDKDINERIFDVGDIHINTAGHDGTEMLLNGLENPEKYKLKIDKKINN